MPSDRPEDAFASEISPEGYSRKDYLTGAWVFGVVGTGFGIAYFFTPAGPFVYMEVAIAAISLGRAVWYGIKARGARADSMAGEDR